MPVIKSKIETTSADFNENKAHMESLVEELNERINTAAQGVENEPERNT